MCSDYGIFIRLLLTIYCYDFQLISFSIMLQKARFSDGSETFEMWRDPPIELILKVYLFNVTNKDEYMSGKDEKLKFQQVGPYAYRYALSLFLICFH